MAVVYRFIVPHCRFEGSITYFCFYYVLQKKLAEDAKKAEQVKVTPHFWNLNEDPALTGMVIHLCPEGTTAIGTDKAKKAPGILLKGLK